MTKIRDLRLLVGAAALATAGSAAGVVIVATMSSSADVRATNQLCYGVSVSGTVNRDVGPVCRDTNLPVLCATPHFDNALITVDAIACIVD